MITLDLTLTPTVVLTDLINAKNNTNFTASNFVFGSPIVTNVLSDPSQTSVTITPVVNSNFYGVQTIHYKRINIADVFNSKIVQVLATSAINLSDVIAEICVDYGINLLSTDYVNVALPAYNSNNPIAPRFVTITMSSSSLLFYGSFNFQLGPRLVPLPNTNTVVRNYFVCLSGLNLTDAKKSIVSLNEDGTTNTLFNFLSNVTAITNFIPDTVLQNTNGNYTLLGDFSLTYTDTSNVSHTVTVQTLVINSLGVVVGYNTARLFNVNTTISYQRNVNTTFNYVVDSYLDSSLGCNGSGIFRYLDSGLLDTTFNPVTPHTASIPYAPQFIRICDDGKIYTVSNPLATNDPANTIASPSMVRIDRLHSDGTIDTSFTTVHITLSNSSANAFLVIDLLPMLNNGFVFTINPTYGLDMGAWKVLVNGNALVNNSQVNGVAYSWNNFIKILDDGSFDPNFNKALLQNTPDSICSTNGSGSPIFNQVNAGFATFNSFSNKQVNINVLSNFLNKYTVFNYKLNPITGYYSIQPLTFDSQGNMQYLNGLDYLEQFMVVGPINVITETNGYIIAYGNIQTILPGGGFSPVYLALFRYKNDCTVDSIVMRVDGLNLNTSVSNVSISQVFVTTTLVAQDSLLDTTGMNFVLGSSFLS